MLRDQDRRVRRGHPWAFANELDLDEAARALAPGSVVTLADANRRPLGTATFNLHSLIAARLFTRAPDTVLDASFFAARLAAAERLRHSFFTRPFYRLAHAEGDSLPGFVIDRFDRVVVVQANTAGADRLTTQLLQALREGLRPSAVVLRNDSPVRRLEGLEAEVRVVHGELAGPVELVEGECRFRVDPLEGQKTGWFYDLARARDEIARLAGGADVLDLYCHTGAFAIRAARAGARTVLGVDRSERALALAAASARLNGLQGLCRFERGEGFGELERLRGERADFDVVVADPPSFVKSRRELGAGCRGYRKLVARAAPLVRAGGFLFVACCSHHVSPERFAQAVREGVASAERAGRVVIEGGAGPDHPIHPMLPESAYLKFRILQLD